MRRNDWIQTFTGKQFYPLDPKPEGIDINDIAHALSMICRFTGHCREFYSVAQHSVLVSLIVSPANALWGLLHDAAEAYLCDVAKPVKSSPAMEVYRFYEDRLMKTIAVEFGLFPDQPGEVKKADGLLLRAEAEHFGLLTPEWSCYGWRKIDTPIFPVNPEVAERWFLNRYKELTQKVEDDGQERIPELKRVG